MLRKLSTRFRSRKEEVNGVNGTNGTTHSVLNGTNGESKGKPNLKERRSSFAPFKSKKDTSNHSVDHSASRQDVEDAFEQFAQLIHASVRILSYLFIDHTLQSSRMASVKNVRAFFSQHTIWREKSLLRNPAQPRPLPTQTSDAVSLDHAQPSGLMSDVKAMGFKDVHTLIDVMKSKAAGELQDDKTYLMEHTIQVRHVSSRARFLAHEVLACQWLAHKVQNPSRFDQCLHRRALELFAASAYVLSRRQIPIPAG